ncbi:MAG: hypothetical protein FVQ84_20255 [Planctomycetes bacterium]|nr:hypothetical protein [Planctomycetota bacterium]
MKIKLLVLAIAVCMIATPARADLFGFHLGNLSSSYDGSASFSATGSTSTTGALYRNIAPTGTAVFDYGSWGTGSESLLVSMSISSILAGTATGSGTITFSDVDGDTFAATVAGTWLNVSGIALFSGALTNVTHTPAGNTFDGHSGDSVSLVYSGTPQPWRGALVQLSAGNWFTGSAFTNALGGSLDVSVVPVPAAVLLGMLGLSVAGLKLRKFA